MLAIILALASAIGYGCSDFYAGLAARVASVIQITLLASVSAAVVVLAALPFAADRRPSGAALAVAVAAAALTRNLRLPRGRPGRLAVIAGVAGAAGTLLYFYASHDGFLAVVAVLTSLYPASTIVLARILLGERLTRLRLTGLALAGACVALIAAGGAG